MHHHPVAQLTLISTLLLPPHTWAQQPSPPTAVPVEATQVKLDTVTLDITAVGSLQPEESVIIHSEIPGRILTLHFSEGQTIPAGEILITLDPAEYQAQLAESDATVKLNKLNFERTKDLLNKNLTSRQAFDEARAKLDESLARQQLDQVRLDKTRIRAPFNGILGLRNISQGAYIETDKELITLVDKSTVKLDFRTPEKLLSHIQVGQTVTLRVDAYPNEQFIGKIYALDSAVDEETRTILLRARIPNPEGKLYPGMFSRITLTLEEHHNAILIPEQAIIPKGQDNFIFKIIDNKAILTKITLGQRRTGDVEIKQGLAANDIIVTSGQLKLRDKTPIMIINTSK